MSRTLQIQPTIPPVPEEQLRHLLLAFFLSQTLKLGPSSSPPFLCPPPPLSLRLKRGPPPVQLSTAHQWPTVRSGSCISDVNERAGGGDGRWKNCLCRSWIGLCSAPYNHASQTHTPASFIYLTFFLSPQYKCDFSDGFWWRIFDKDSHGQHLKFSSSFLRLIPASCAKGANVRLVRIHYKLVVAEKNVYDPV